MKFILARNIVDENNYRFIKHEFHTRSGSWSDRRDKARIFHSRKGAYDAKKHVNSENSFVCEEGYIK